MNYCFFCVFNFVLVLLLFFLLKSLVGKIFSDVILCFFWNGGIIIDVVFFLINLLLNFNDYNRIWCGLKFWWLFERMVVLWIMVWIIWVVSLFFDFMYIVVFGLKRSYSIWKVYIFFWCSFCLVLIFFLYIFVLR